MAGVLDGIRIIDFGQYIAGPLAAMLLADQGADVIRIDPPGGPRLNSPANATWNRGKRSIVLDLKHYADRGIARRLLQSADVVIENFRPGVMDRLGVGPEAMTSANPGLIYCSLPGFASDDPRASIPAWEGVVGAASATYFRTPLQFNLWPDRDPNHPVYTAVPIASVFAAYLGVTSIVMALYARERDGLGQRIDVPMFDAMFAALGHRGLRVHNAPEGQGGGSPWAHQFECADGRWVHMLAHNTRAIHRFLKAAGVEHWIEEGLVARERLAQNPALQDGLSKRLIDLFKTRTAQEWEDSINEAGTAAAFCRTSAEWLEHPHAREARMIIEVNDPQYGLMLQPGIQARLSESPGAVRGPASALDQHRQEILAEIAAPSPKVAGGILSPSEVRGALADVRVVDLTIVLAGPTCGRTLAEFGADVIKIDDPNREGGVVAHLDINRGKRSMLLDLKTPAGLKVFWRLVDTADVVVENFRQGVVERLGVGYEQVRQRRPDIVYASLNAYGRIGPWAPRPGWEYQGQAVTGMQARLGGDGPPSLQPFPVNDYGTGILGAYAVALALYHRQCTGKGQHVDTALAYTACTTQSIFLQGYRDKEWHEPRGQDAVGTGPLHRFYRASDGWLFLGARDSDTSALESVAELAGIHRTPKSRLATFLEKRLAKGTTADWVNRLTATGVGAQRLTTVSEIMSDPWVKAHGLSLTREHPGVGLVTTTGASPRLSRTPARPGQPAPPPGSDASAILNEIGLVADLERLVNKKVVALPL